MFDAVPADEIVEALRDTDNDLVVDDPLYYHQDDLFSVYAITDASGAVVERYDYSDYGEVTVQRADGTVKPEEYWVGNRHTYTGRLVEWDTGLLQYRHRYLSPTLGRFVQRDPLGYVDGMSEVAYVATNPASRMDPSGLGWICKRPLQNLRGLRGYNPFRLRWNMGLYHEHIWYEESYPSEHSNEGFFKEGVRPETNPKYATGGHRYDCEFFPNDAALRKAAEICKAKEPFCRPDGDGYNFVPLPFDGETNCQGFANCVRDEYSRLTTASRRCLKWQMPHPGAGHSIPRCIAWQTTPPEYDPMLDRKDPSSPCGTPPPPAAPVSPRQLPQLPAELRPDEPGGPLPGSPSNPVYVGVR